MEIRINKYLERPKRDDERLAFDIAVLPEFQIYWKGGLRTVYFGWIFWDIVLDFSKDMYKMQDITKYDKD